MNLYEIDLWSFALLGWFAAFCVASAHISIRDGIIAELRRRHEAWAQMRVRFAGTADGAYADGFSAGLREAELLLDNDGKPPDRPLAAS